MSYMRVQVIEIPVSWAEGMKVFRKIAEPALNAAKKAGLLFSYSMVQTGDHCRIVSNVGVIRPQMRLIL